MRKLSWLFGLLSLPAALSAQYLITNVTVVDVEKQRLLPMQQVTVRAGRIERVERVNKKAIPTDLQVIDGSGKFLMPGLVDGHVHFFQSGGLFTRPDAIDLRKKVPYSTEIAWAKANMLNLMKRYVQAGVTTVFDVGSTYNLLRLRDSLQGKPGATRVFMAGPLLTTYEPEPFKNLGADAPFKLMTDTSNARQYVREQLPYKPDFIKIWYIVQGKDLEASALKNLPLVQAVIDEAHKHKLRVAVHATEKATAELAVQAGADYLVHNIDDEILDPAFIQQLKARNVALCPTLVVGHNYMHVFGDQYQFHPRELNHAHPTPVRSIIDYPLPDTALAKNYIQYAKRTGIPNQHTTDSISFRNLKMLADAGVLLVTGTDAGNIGTQHATSYQNELEAMQRAGLSTWQMLRSSTIQGAQALGQDSAWGSIKAGRWADMLLLDANPIDSISHWQKLALVFRQGQAFRPDTLIRYSPADLVNQQLNAYNAHDVEAFLVPYADDVEIFELGGKALAKGKAQMREMYQFLKRVPNMHCEVTNRMVQGNVVVDEEKITGVGPKPVFALAVYEIEGQKIKRVYFPKQ